MFLFLALVLSSFSAAAADSPSAALQKMAVQSAQGGARMAYIFDLDETTVDSSPRRFAAILEALDESCGRNSMPPPDCDSLRSIRLDDLYRLRNRYDDLAYLRHYGARDEAFLSAVGKRALEIYLSGRFIVDLDRLYAGVQSFLRELKRNGSPVFFVSSRSLERQGGATRRFLRARGLLRTGEDSFLYLKPEGEKSAEFKRRAVLEIRRRVLDRGGRVAGVFENEPENLQIWVETFPNARAFFVRGAYMKEGPIPRKAVVLDDFRRE